MSDRQPAAGALAGPPPVVSKFDSHRVISDVLCVLYVPIDNCLQLIVKTIIRKNLILF